MTEPTDATTTDATSSDVTASASGATGSDVAAADTAPPTADRPALDLEAIERDLAGVEAALVRLDDGTYWTDETTGTPIPDEVLAADPVTRSAGATG